MPGPTKEWLVSFDTDRIKNYIFATNSLKEIRGASALLVQQDEKNKSFVKQDDQLVYAAGGGGAILSPSQNNAQWLAETIEREFRAATVTGTTTAVALSPEQLTKSKWFGRKMADAAKALQSRKASKGELGVLPVEPFMRLCDSCGQHAAVARLEAKVDPSGDLLCMSCARKRETGWEERHEGYVPLFLQHVKNTAQKERWRKENLRLPKDLQALGEFDNSGYVGFVIMDGNRMGKLLELMANPEDYYHFSSNLAELLKKIVFDVLAKEAKPTKGKLPFEIVLIGGDDIMIFTGASVAIKFAVEVLKSFEQKSKRFLEDAGLLRNDLFPKLCAAYPGEALPIDENEPFWKHKKLTMAAGVVICHSNFPIPALVEIGEALLKNAKKKCAEAQVGYRESAIDFQVVTGSAMDLEMARVTVPHCRPYLLNEIEKLWKYACDLSKENIPQTQLQMVYDACHQNSRAAGTIATLHMLGRLKKNQRGVLKKFFGEFPESGSSLPAQWPWVRVGDPRHDPESPRTAFVDLVDMYGFID